MAVLKQNHNEFNEHTVLNTVMMGHDKLWSNIKAKEELYSNLIFLKLTESKFLKLEEEFAEMDGWNAESDAAALLSGLGIEEEHHYKLLKDVDGNYRVRVLLAQALFGNPDVLISG